LRLLAEAAFKQGNFAEAEKLFRQVITYLELAIGDNGIEVAITLECLSRTLELQGKVLEAEAAKDRAAQILCTRRKPSP